MDMNEKAAQPSMEEILASIRRIIAEEPGGTQAHDAKLGAITPASASSGVAHNTQAGPSDLGALDEGADFQLPSMFRPSTVPAAEKHVPVFSRLTEALRQGAPEPAAVALPQFPVYGAASGVEHADPAAASRTVTPLPALSSLRSPRLDPAAVVDVPRPEAMPVGVPLSVFPVPEAPAPVAQPVTPPVSEEPVKRQMAPFKDTRFSRMTGPAQPSPTAVTPPVQAAVNVEVVAHQPEAAAPAAFPAAPSYSVEAPVMAQAVEAPVSVDPSSILPPPMPTSAAAAAGPSLGAALVAALQPGEAGVHSAYNSAPAVASGNGSIEDTAAELLRPMLRLWLAENMPRMVEKALFIEVAESVKTGRPATH